MLCSMEIAFHTLLFISPQFCKTNNLSFSKPHHSTTSDLPCPHTGSITSSIIITISTFQGSSPSPSPAVEAMTHLHSSSSVQPQLVHTTNREVSYVQISEVLNSVVSSLSDSVNVIFDLPSSSAEFILQPNEVYIPISEIEIIIAPSSIRGYCCTHVIYSSSLY